MAEQLIWSCLLAVCWIVVAYGQYTQGKKVRRNRSARNVSIYLPLAVIFAQSILFIKGLYYIDWSLIFGAIVVNGGAFYNLYFLLKFRNH